MSLKNWSYIINFGPNGEENYANVYDSHGHLVGNLRIHHAVQIVKANTGLGVLDMIADGGPESETSFEDWARSMAKEVLM